MSYFESARDTFRIAVAIVNDIPPCVVLLDNIEKVVSFLFGPFFV